jgi:hypothetical protein
MLADCHEFGWQQCTAPEPLAATEGALTDERQMHALLVAGCASLISDPHVVSPTGW